MREMRKICGIVVRLVRYMAVVAPLGISSFGLSLVSGIATQLQLYDCVLSKLITCNK